MMFLLDVNALIANQYSTHVHHARVRAWIAQMQAELGDDAVTFSTCPITELGFMRIASRTGLAASVTSARTDLRNLRTGQNMDFIPDAISARNLPPWVRKSEQTTDGYLLALANSNRGYLATLDRSIPGAVLIPSEAPDPLMVREEAEHSGWAA
jgi:uncharacterized protein